MENPSKSDTIEMDLKGLDNFMKVIKAEKAKVKVGILGDSDSRSGDMPSNATLGLMHEYGYVGNNGKAVPARSFLRMPLTEKLAGALDKSEFIDKYLINEIIKVGRATYLLKRIGFVAVGVIQKAFGSEGFGNWTPSIMKWKKNKQTMVESGQLMKSIRSELTE